MDRQLNLLTCLPTALAPKGKKKLLPRHKTSAAVTLSVSIKQAMPESAKHYGQVWTTDGGTYDWQMAARSRGRARHRQKTQYSAGRDSVSSIHATLVYKEVQRPGRTVRSVSALYLKLN